VFSQNQVEATSSRALAIMFMHSVNGIKENSKRSALVVSGVLYMHKMLDLGCYVTVKNTLAYYTTNEIA